ncbi:vacuolar iron transporter homolog 5-like [Camellia sinensis]|uniref:Vacuolar iron transporter n=1 Tax=Camellia sinensis var. sinensis TaxID=542762 RepID=A0A4S4EID1_CAMSN|nr:vacuolar iron transporter homolog 5-like [Camellia sinensis]THG16271.1 hypothetical protein TEA_023828 [Camellia sinensis var. sinensis]
MRPASSHGSKRWPEESISITRGLWLRAVVLGGNEGIVAAAFLVMGVGTFVHDMKSLIIAGLVGIVAGALSTAVAEFASVCTQVDTVKAQEDRDTRMGREGLAERVVVPSPTQVAVAASLAYMIKNFLLKFNVLDELKMK